MNGAAGLRSIMRSFCGQRQQIKEVFEVGTGRVLNTEYYKWRIHTIEWYGLAEEIEQVL